jgi:hypothetical protein
MAYSKSFFAVAAGCSFASVVTTMILTFGADYYPAPQSLEDRIALLSNPVFQLRMWTYYVHPFVTLVAALGAYVIAKRHDAGFAMLGAVFLGLWAFGEALQQALSIVALNWTWRGTYATADAATQALYRSHMSMFEGLWDGLYFLLLTGFILGSVFMGLALIRGRSLTLVVGILMLVIGALSVLTLLAGYNGPPWAGQVSEFVYPVLQPVTRTLIGVWLLREGWRLSAIS